MMDTLTKLGLDDGISSARERTAAKQKNLDAFADEIQKRIRFLEGQRQAGQLSEEEYLEKLVALRDQVQENEPPGENLISPGKDPGTEQSKQAEKLQMGTVIAVSDSFITEHGQTVKCPVKLGDTVLYKKWGGNEVKLDGKELQVMKYEDVIAKMA